MNISANDVKELRERTGAGMMECKKALVAANGNIETAIEDMRKSGITKAAKKAGRITAEGLVAAQLSQDNRMAVMVEVNCETDFVSRDSNFKTFVAQVAACALASQITDVTKIGETMIPDTAQTLEQARQQLITKIGENIQVRRITLMQTTGTIGTYVHSGRIGALVALSTDNTELAKDIAMHVAASNPQVIKPEQVSSDLISQEKDIFMAQSADSGKPREIIEKMVAGRISKFVNEVSLTGQAFVKDPAKSIGELLKAAAAEVTEFTRFEVGEGIEKVVEDFSKAVAEITGGA
jgi:elongation factor Ts